MGKNETTQPCLTDALTHSRCPAFLSDRFSTIGSVRFTINADDFGYSTSVNAGVMEGFEEGVIHTATIMTNMPQFEEACQLVHSRGLEGRIGIHLNLSEGQPLSRAMKGSPKFCSSNGCYRKSIDNTTLYLDRATSKALREEIKLQVLACLSRGISPTHIDSHNHFHTIWPVLTAVIEAAKEFGIREVRLSRNVGLQPAFIKRIYKLVHNGRLRRHSLARSHLFGSVADFLCWQGTVSGIAEIMVHPEMSDTGKVIDRITNRELRAEIGNLRDRLDQNEMERG